MRCSSILLFTLVFNPEIFSLPADVICDKNLIEGTEAQKKNRYDDAAAAYEKIEKSKCKKSSQFYFQYGKLLVRAKNYPKAIKMLETYINRTGKKGKHYKEALSLYIEAENGIENKRESQKNAVTDHQRENYQALAKKMRNKADDKVDDYKEVLYDLEDEVKSHYKKAKIADSKYHHANYQRTELKKMIDNGYCHVRPSQYCRQWQSQYETANYNAQYYEGERDGHIRDANDALERHKEEKRRYKRRAEKAHQDGIDAGNFEDNIYYFTIAIEIDNKKAKYYYNRALTYYMVRLYEEALDDLDEAIDLDDEQYGYYYTRGQAHEELGNKKKASFNYNEALRLADSKKEKTALRKKIKALGYEPIY